MANVQLEKCGVDRDHKMECKLKDGSYRYKGLAQTETTNNVKGDPYFWLLFNDLNGTPDSFYSRKVLTDKTDGGSFPTEGMVTVVNKRFVAFAAK